MAELPASVDEWLAGRDRSPLSRDAVLRYEYVADGKDRSLDRVVEFDGAGRFGDDRLGFRDRHHLHVVIEAALESDGYEEGPAAKGGRYEVVTVHAGHDLHQVVFHNHDNRSLAALRDAVLGSGPERPS